MRGVGGGVGGHPLRDHLWQGPPLPVTLRLIHPPPKMTQGGNDPPNPPSSPSNSILELKGLMGVLVETEAKNKKKAA